MTVLNKQERKEIINYNKMLSKFFDLPTQDFKIRLVSKKELRRISGKKFNWLISFVVEKCIYILPRRKISRDFFETIKHELVHIYVHKKFPGTAGFLDEGLAEYFSRPYKKEWQKKLLEEKAGIIKYMAGKKHRYLSAFSLVYFIIKRFGKEKLFKAAKNLKPFNKMSIKEANKIFKSIFKMSIKKFENEWYDFIRSNK